MAMIYNSTSKDILAALSPESMSGWRFLEPSEILRAGMQQLMANGEWWPLDWRVECSDDGQGFRADDFPHALAYRIEVQQ